MDFDVLHIWYDSEDVSGLNLYTLLLFFFLQKCLTVSHHLEEQGASTKITMKVSSDYCLLLSFYVSDVLDVWIISLVKSILSDPDPYDLWSCWKITTGDRWKKSSQQHWNDSSSGSESINESRGAAPHAVHFSHQQRAEAAQLCILLCMQFESLGWTWSMAFTSEQKPVSHAQSAVPLSPT